MSFTGDEDLQAGPAAGPAAGPSTREPPAGLSPSSQPAAILSPSSHLPGAKERPRPLRKVMFSPSTASAPPTHLHPFPAPPAATHLPLAPAAPPSPSPPPQVPASLAGTASAAMPGQGAAVALQAGSRRISAASAAAAAADSTVGHMTPGSSRAARQAAKKDSACSQRAVDSAQRGGRNGLVAAARLSRNPPVGTDFGGGLCVHVSGGCEHVCQHHRYHKCVCLTVCVCVCACVSAPVTNDK